MRRIILIAITVLFWQTVSAQQTSGYNAVIATIDSLIYVVQNHISVEVPHRDSLGFYSLSINEQNRVIDHVLTLYDQTENGNLLNLARSLWVRFHDSRTDTTIQDRVARLYLDKTYHTFRESLTFLGRIANYSDETRERLRNLLEGNKTEEDIQARKMLATRDIKRDFRRDIDNDVNRIVRETNRDDNETRAFLTDSVTAVFIEDRIQFMNSFPPFGRRDILRIGSSNDLRFVAGLERILETDFPPPSPLTPISSWKLQINDIREATIYALAKLGVQKYLDKVYARERFNYRYLGTKEAFLIHLKRNFVWNRRCRTMIDDRAISPCAIAELVNAVGFDRHLANIPDEIRRMATAALFGFVPPQNLENYDPNQDERNRAYIEKAYYVFSWIMENQDVWEIRRQIDYF